MKTLITLMTVVLLTGCASGMMKSIEENTSQQLAQSKMMLSLMQTQSNLAEDETLKAPAVIEVVTVEEVEQRSKTASAMTAGFGIVGSLAGDAVDSAMDGEIIEVTKYTIRAETGEAVIITQPDGDEFESGFEKGDEVFFRSTKPLSEADNTLYLVSR